MKKFLLLFSVLGLFAAACNPEDKPEGNESIYGEWSMGRMESNAGTVDVRMHLSISKDGKFVLTMPAWLEQRLGTYEIKGDELILTVTELEAVIIPPDAGYRNAYERYLVWPKDSQDLPTFADWAKQMGDDEIVMHVKYSLEKDGLHLDGLFGMPREEPWFLDPDFDAVAECRKHCMYE